MQYLFRLSSCLYWKLFFLLDRFHHFYLYNKKMKTKSKKRIIPHRGEGLYVKPYKGKGLYVKPYIGKGILNTIIDNLPISLHVPGYNYCGPGTKLRGQPAVNKLDEYCKQHDVFYSKNTNTAARNKADLVLADQAWERVKSSDASIGERAAAY